VAGRIIWIGILGKIVARNKDLLQGIIGFGRPILADTPPPELKGASFAHFILVTQAYYHRHTFHLFKVANRKSKILNEKQLN
jgi:hypothetical protein